MQSGRCHDQGRRAILPGALDTLENQASVDEILLGQIWLVLGETQRKAGENVRALDTLQRAATSARRLNSLEMRARSH